MRIWTGPFVTAIAAVMLLTGCANGEPSDDASSVEFKVGIVFDIGGRGDHAFNDSAFEGLLAIAREYGGFLINDPDAVSYGDRIQIQYLEPRIGGQDRIQLMRSLAEQGYDLVFGVGYTFTEAVERVAGDYTETHFVLIDGIIPNLAEDGNVTAVTFAENEGSFLVGALAGMLTRGGNGRVGFIGGMDIPLIHGYHGGFAAGAMYANPALRPEGMIMFEYIGNDPTGFNDPRTAERIAGEMFDGGADVVFHAAGASGEGLFLAAYQRGRWAIGVDFDQAAAYAEAATALERAIGERVLTSMVKRIDRAVFLTARDLIAGGGRLAGGTRILGLEEEAVGFTVGDVNRNLIERHTEELETVRERIVSGEIVVPHTVSAVAEWATETF